ncbi:MAG: hypothetical protein CTY36_01165 [Methylocystis sp.]|nr:MAG: hypothetical protein CTY36_01165 [Methylocystis sp.]
MFGLLELSINSAHLPLRSARLLPLCGRNRCDDARRLRRGRRGNAAPQLGNSDKLVLFLWSLPLSYTFQVIGEWPTEGR